MQKMKSRDLNLSNKQIDFLQQGLRSLMFADTRDDFNKKLKQLKNCKLWKSQTSKMKRAVAYFNIHWLTDEDISKWANYNRTEYHKMMDTTNASEAWNQLSFI